MSVVPVENLLPVDPHSNRYQRPRFRQKTSRPKISRYEPPDYYEDENQDYAAYERSSQYYPHYDDHEVGGYSHSGYCCPLVVDPIIVLTLLGAVAAATFFLNIAITMNIVGRKRRRKRRSFVNEGERKR